jgi:hypothetical protein
MTGVVLPGIGAREATSNRDLTNALHLTNELHIQVHRDGGDPVSKEGFVEAVRLGLSSAEARGRMAGGDFSDVPEAELDDQERSLLQAAAKEIVENPEETKEIVESSEVEGFDWYRLDAWGGYSVTPDPRMVSVQQATDYMQQ